MISILKSLNLMETSKEETESTEKEKSGSKVVNLTLNIFPKEKMKINLPEKPKEK